MKTNKQILVLLSCALFLITACNNNHSSNAASHPDSKKNPPAQPSRTDILFQKEWQLDELHRNVEGVNSEYLRGIINTTGVAYENIRIKFESDGTGSYIDELSVKHTMQWAFTTPDQRNASMVIGPPNKATFSWRMIELKDNFLHTVSPVNSNSLYAARYIQVQ